MKRLFFYILSACLICSLAGCKEVKVDKDLMGQYGQVIEDKKDEIIEGLDKLQEVAGSVRDYVE